MVHSLLSSLPTITDEEDTPKALPEEDEYLPLEPDADEHGTQSAIYPAQMDEPLVNDSDVATAASIPLPPSRPSSPTNLVEHRSSSPQGPPRPTIPLSSLLQTADALYAQYPPTHPALHLSSIMGPQSVVFTWNTHVPDDDAEAMYYADRVEEYLWSLRVRAQAAPFAREALRMLEADVGGLGAVRAAATTGLHGEMKM